MVNRLGLAPQQRLARRLSAARWRWHTDASMHTCCSALKEHAAWCHEMNTGVCTMALRGPHQDTGEQANLGEGLAELVELLLERRVVLLLRGLLDLALDLADLGGHADRVHHRHAAAVGDSRRREQHALLALQLAVLVRQMRRVLRPGAPYMTAVSALCCDVIAVL